MYFLATSKQFQEKLLSAESYGLIDDTFKRIDARIPTVALFVMDNKFTTMEVRHDAFSVTGFELSEKQEFMDKMNESLRPEISTKYRSLDGSYQITITHPVVNKNTGELIGVVGVAIPTAKLFAHHGNIIDVNTQYLIVYDKDKINVAGPLTDLLNVNYFGNVATKYYGNSNIRTEHASIVFSGISNHAVYKTGVGEVIDVGSPVLVNGQNEYFVFLITPTEKVIAQTNTILKSSESQNLVILITIVSAFVLFLLKRSADMKKDTEIKLQRDREMHDIKVKNERLSAMGTLAARLAHDLRNPLSVIKNTLEIIYLQNRYDEKTTNYLQRIERSVSRMSHQVNSVLDFVRVQPLDISNNSLFVVVSKICENYANLINIKFDLPQSDLQITCDSKKMEIVFENLMRNAIEAMNNSGTITIRWKQADHDIVIEVQDDGPSIPEENLEKIFDPMFTTKQTGTGLGLVSCRNIIEQHGGTLTVRNNPVTFTISIPQKSLSPNLIYKSNK
ncbi:MAG: sensor histidine kinase [Nitrososphaerota archaeon]|nr:sensor histidine kinase [Nitrososphaerota archaeon]